MNMRELRVDLDNPTTIHDQLKAEIRRQVQRGQTRPGVRLPTVRQLSLDLEVNANVVKRICSELEGEGYLMFKTGTGTYGIGLAEEVAERHKQVFDV